MANYNLTDQTISSSFQQLLQKDETTGTLYDGTGSVVSDLDITSSYALTASYADNVDDPTWDSIQNKPSGLVSGAAQIETLLPSGVVSGSSQIDITQTTGNLTSSRIDGIVLSASYAENGGVTSIIAGTNIIIDQSQGDVTIQATTTASAEWDNIANKPAGIVSGSSQLTSSYDTRYQLSGSEAGLPSGVVSGSSQIILQDTTGDLSGSRIDGQVTSAVSSSHSDFAVTSSYALNFNPSATASYALTASFLEGNVESADEAERVTYDVQNNSGVTLQKGTPVHVVGSTNGTSLVVAASASLSSTMPAHGILNSSLNAGQDGVATILGQITGVDTSLFNAGDTVYVGPDGGYTNQKPTGSNLIQNLGIVKKVDVTNGTGEIFGSGRSNDVPNITNGYGWFGNTDGVAEPQSTGSFAKTDLSNIFTQNQTITGSIDVSTEVIGTQITANEAVITPLIESTTGTIDVGSNMDGTGVQIAATQLEAFEAVITPQIESSTGTITSLSNISQSGSLNLSPGNPLTADEIQVSAVVTDLLESSVGTVDLVSSLDMSGAPAGKSISNPNGTISAGEGNFDALITDQIETGGSQIDILSPMNFQGKITSAIQTIAISANTASIDFSQPQMQVLTLPASGDTRIETSNVSNGQVVNVLIKATGAGTVTLSDTILQPSGSTYQATPTNGGRDILTITSFDNSTTSETYLVNVVNLV